MTFLNHQNEQTHPQELEDKQVLEQLEKNLPTDYDLAELARLKIRYHNFPGARDIQAGLERLMNKWDLTEEVLYEKTRQLHLSMTIYGQKKSLQQEDLQDW